MKVFILEDEILLRELVKSYITDFTDMEICGMTGNGSEAMKKILALEPDLVFADIRVPQVSGLEILYLLRRKLPQVKVVLFSGSITPDKVRLAYEGGVDAFIEKGQGLDEFRKAIDAIKEGGRYFSEHAQRIIEELEGVDTQEVLY